MSKASEFEPEFAPLTSLLPEGAGFTNPRVTYDKKEIVSLADSIAERKLQTPLLVWVADENGAPLKGEDGSEILVILSGKRRRAALELLVESGRGNGYEKAVPYKPFKGSLVEASVEAIAENIDREDTTDFDKAMSIQNLVGMGLQQKDIAAKLHKSTPWVSRVYSAYRYTIEPVRKAWQAGQITKEAAQNISTFVTKKKGEQPVPDFAKQQAALDELFALVPDAKDPKGAKPSKKAKGKARHQAKRNAGKKADRLSNALLADYIVELEGVKKDKGYLHGMLDTLRLAAGLIGEDALAPVYRAHKKKLAADSSKDAKTAKGHVEKAAKSVRESADE